MAPIYSPGLQKTGQDQCASSADGVKHHLPRGSLNLQLCYTSPLQSASLPPLPSLPPPRSSLSCSCSSPAYSVCLVCLSASLMSLAPAPFHSFTVPTPPPISPLHYPCCTLCVLSRPHLGRACRRCPGAPFPHFYPFKEDRRKAKSSLVYTGIFRPSRAM